MGSLPGNKPSDGTCLAVADFPDKSVLAVPEFDGLTFPADISALIFNPDTHLGILVNPVFYQLIRLHLF